MSKLSKEERIKLEEAVRDYIEKNDLSPFSVKRTFEEIFVDSLKSARENGDKISLYGLPRHYCNGNQGLSELYDLMWGKREFDGIIKAKDNPHRDDFYLRNSKEEMIIPSLDYNTGIYNALQDFVEDNTRFIAEEIIKRFKVENNLIYRHEYDDDFKPFDLRIWRAEFNKEELQNGIKQNYHISEQLKEELSKFKIRNNSYSHIMPTAQLMYEFIIACFAANGKIPEYAETLYKFGKNDELVDSIHQVRINAEEFNNVLKKFNIELAKEEREDKKENEIEEKSVLSISEEKPHEENEEIEESQEEKPKFLKEILDSKNNSNQPNKRCSCSIL